MPIDFNDDPGTEMAESEMVARRYFDMKWKAIRTK